jgi:hypothetical protein
MRNTFSAARQPFPLDTTVLRGTEREAVLARLRVVTTSPEGEVLLEDDLGQPWVDRCAGDGDPDFTDRTETSERELVRVSWREVCLNWPDAVNREEKRPHDG